MSSCHLLLCRSLDLFPLHGCHSVQRLVHLLSSILATCPAHLHFCVRVYFIMSVILVLFLISEHGFFYLVALDPIFPLHCSLSCSQFVIYCNWKKLALPDMSYHLSKGRYLIHTCIVRKYLRVQQPTNKYSLVALS